MRTIRFALSEAGIAEGLRAIEQEARKLNGRVDAAMGEIVRLGVQTIKEAYEKSGYVGSALPSETWISGYARGGKGRISALGGQEVPMIEFGAGDAADGAQFGFTPGSWSQNAPHDLGMGQYPPSWKWNGMRFTQQPPAHGFVKARTAIDTYAADIFKRRMSE